MGRQVVKCDEFPSEIGGFEMDDCEDDTFADYCRTLDGDLVCIGARNIEKDVDLSREVTKTWTPEGFGRLEGDDEIREFFVGSAGHMGFSDDKIVGEMENLVSSFDDKAMLGVVVEDMRQRR